jgi:hypothetical protein
MNHYVKLFSKYKQVLTFDTPINDLSQSAKITLPKVVITKSRRMRWVGACGAYG